MNFNTNTSFQNQNQVPLKETKKYKQNGDEGIWFIRGYIPLCEDGCCHLSSYLENIPPAPGHLWWHMKSGSLVFTGRV